MNQLSVEKIHNGIFHITEQDAKHLSLLSKYHILKDAKKEFDPTLLFESVTESASEHEVSFSFDNRTLSLSFEEKHKGYLFRIPIDEGTRFFGLGDVSRDSIERSGKKYDLWATDYVGYGPIPFLMTASGWGLFINATYKISIDINSTGNGLLEIAVHGGTPDVFVFFAPSMKTILNLYTEVTGKIILLPKSAYGFTFVCNEEETARQLLEDSAKFRERGIPCDIMSLEPQWMTKHYDFTTEKTWSQERFFIPPWHADNYSGPHSFFWNLREMGMKLSLWLCCDYDLLWEEEQTALQINKLDAKHDDEHIKDAHLSANVVMDKLTVPGEPWFQHLEKFVEQGACAFKMDAANQALEHSDRLWAGTYLDEEVHNAYSVILAKQMKEGYEKKTGQRAMVFTSVFYAGTQQYAATWSGDTGGDERTLISIINNAMSGHTNATCDMDIADPHSIHYASLLSWAQGFSWCCWHYPWLIGSRLEGILKYYNTLRSSLFPYIYSNAHEAARSGMPIARPLPLVYENTNRFDHTSNLYMLGNSLLVGAFNMNFDLPDGIWTDYFTKETYEGKVEYQIPEGRGGALFVKAGSILVTQPPMLYLEEKSPEIYNIALYPGDACDFKLIEDDGNTYDYLNGAFCTTHMHMNAFDSNTLSFTIDKRVGQFDKMPDLTDFNVTVHGVKVAREVLLNGQECEFSYENNTLSFTIPATLRNDTVNCTINF